jgi:hypothetical protein
LVDDFEALAFSHDLYQKGLGARKHFVLQSDNIT